MLNVVALLGRFTKDPELKYTQNNIPVTSFTLAVDRRYSGSDGEKQTDFINCVAWRQTAEFVSKWFRKGQLAAVDGSIQTRKYQDRDGYNRTAVEVVVDNIHFAESRRDTESRQADKAAQMRNDAAAGQEKKGVSDYAPAWAQETYQQGRLDAPGAEDFQVLEDDDDLPF